jgi:hypothetical protein
LLRLSSIFSLPPIVVLLVASCCLRPIAVRRFTEGARGGGKYRGWDETGIGMYNDLAARIKLLQEAATWELQNFEIDLTCKTKFRQAANISDNGTGQEDGEEESTMVSGMQPRKCLVMVRKAMKRMTVPLVGCPHLLLKLLLRVLLKVGMGELLLQRRSVVWCRACLPLVVLEPACTEKQLMGCCGWHSGCCDPQIISIRKHI